MEVERATRSRNDAGQLPIQLKQDLWPHGCHHLPPAVCWDWRFLLWSFLRNHKEIMQEEATCLRSGHGHADHKRSALITGLNEPERTQTSFRGDTYGHIDLSVDESDLGLFVNTNTHTHTPSVIASWQNLLSERRRSSSYNSHQTLSIFCQLALLITFRAFNDMINPWARSAHVVGMWYL